MHNQYLTVQVKPNGLIVRLTAEGRQELADRDYSDKPDYLTFIDLFESYWTNGWTMLNAEQVGGLTGCEIILTPDAQFNDDGDLIAADPVYWHERYAVEDAIEKLLEGELFLLKA